MCFCGPLSYRHDWWFLSRTDSGIFLGKDYEKLLIPRSTDLESHFLFDLIFNFFYFIS